MSDPVAPQVAEPPEQWATRAREEAVAASATRVSATRRFKTRGLSLRAFAAKGVIINTLFDIGLSGLGLIRGFATAAFLTRADYGLWGILLVSLGMLSRLKLVGIADKYVQQEERDQELAFQKAFTLEILITVVTMVPVAAALPVIAIVYHHWALVAPGGALLTVLLAGALQAPFWIYLRDMDFVRQRTLMAVEPVVAFLVTVGLAVAGAGYWSLAGGAVAGAWSGAAVAFRRCPYKLRWRYDSGSLRVYARFSGPIFIATISSVILANSAVLASNAKLGVGAVGVVALAGNITAFTSRVDDIVGTTLYPAICAIQNRLDLLHESFVKSNRLALMWAMPFGLAITLFASDLVHFVIGSRWQPAVSMLQITGVVAAVGQIGWNWDDYFRARDNTVPLAVASCAATAAFLAFGLPLLSAQGLTGLAFGIGVSSLVHVACRGWYLTRLFEGFSFARHILRAILPSMPAVAFVLVARVLEDSQRSPGAVVGELVAYLLITLLATWALEKNLLREALGYILARVPRSLPSTGG